MIAFSGQFLNWALSDTKVTLGRFMPEIRNMFALHIWLPIWVSTNGMNRALNKARTKAVKQLMADQTNPRTVRMMLNMGIS
jgi:hypothetical protein